MNAPTIKDVANAAGVSVATISRVLSNPDLVKPATKEHVLRIIKEMNCQTFLHVSFGLRQQELSLLLFLI